MMRHHNPVELLAAGFARKELRLITEEPNSGLEFVRLLGIASFSWQLAYQI